MEKEFKVKLHTTTVLCLTFFIAYTAYFVFAQSVASSFVQGLIDGSLLILISVGWLLYAVGLTPYKYVVDKKSLYKCYRLRKNVELDLMDCETICDPVPRASEMFARAHAIEIYTTKKKRHCFFPKQRVEFVDAVSKANKRIHVTVQDYTDVHRKLEKRLRKEKLKEERRAKRERESE